MSVNAVDVRFINLYGPTEFGGVMRPRHEVRLDGVMCGRCRSGAPVWNSSTVGVGFAVASGAGRCCG